MGKYWSNSWTNVSKKPKGFKFVSTNVYEYIVSILVYESYNKYTAYFETIPVKYYVDKDTNYREIDISETDKIIKKKLKVDFVLPEYYKGLGMFKRDGQMFPFIEHIQLSEKESKQYVYYKRLRERMIKIKSICQKI